MPLPASEPDTSCRRSRFLSLPLRSSCGNAAVEFAIVAPLLAVILTAIVELGLAIMGQFSVQEAVLAGANQASHNGWNAANIKTAITSSDPHIVATDIAVTRFCGCPVGHALTTVAQCDQDLAAPNTCPAGCSATCSDGIVARKYAEIHATMARPGVLGQSFGLPATVGSKMTTKLP